MSPFGTFSCISWMIPRKYALLAAGFSDGAAICHSNDTEVVSETMNSIPE